MSRSTSAAEQTILDVSDSGRVPGRVPDLLRDQPQPTTTVSEGRQAEPPSTTSSVPTSIASSWSEIAQADLTVQLYDRLLQIAAAPAGWRGPGSKPLKAESLQSFLTFWLEVRSDAAEPELALAPDGTLHAEWYHSHRKRLDIRFGGSQLVFGLFANNLIHEGTERANTLASLLKSHPSKPLRWHAN